MYTEVKTHTIVSHRGNVNFVREVAASPDVVLISVSGQGPNDLISTREAIDFERSAAIRVES